MKLFRCIHDSRKRDLIAAQVITGNHLLFNYVGEDVPPSSVYSCRWNMSSCLAECSHCKCNSVLNLHYVDVDIDS